MVFEYHYNKLHKTCPPCLCVSWEWSQLFHQEMQRHNLWQPVNDYSACRPAICRLHLICPRNNNSTLRQYFTNNNWKKTRGHFTKATHEVRNICSLDKHARGDIPPRNSSWNNSPKNVPCFPSDPFADLVIMPHHQSWTCEPRTFRTQKNYEGRRVSQT